MGVVAHEAFVGRTAELDVLKQALDPHNVFRHTANVLPAGRLA